MAELKEILEGLIFVYRGVISPKVVEGVLKEDFSAAEIEEALQRLKEEYDARGGVIEFHEVAGGYEFGTRSDLADWVRKLDHYEHHRRLSRPALETLAIVAYRQPVTRPEIEQIRGVNVERILRSLIEKKLIRILGRKDVPGKPLVYGTTKEFLEYFGLKGLGELPSLKEFPEPEPSEEIEEAEILPMEESDEGREGSDPPDGEPAGEEPPEGGGEGPEESTEEKPEEG